jgi:hypothetical protein
VTLVSNVSGILDLKNSFAVYFKKILDSCNTFVFQIILKVSMILFVLAKTKMHHKDEFS